MEFQEVGHARCVTRVYGDTMEVPPTKLLPRWMVAPECQRPREQPQDSSTPTSSGQNSSTAPSTNMHHTPTDEFSTDTPSYGPMYRTYALGDSSVYGET